MTPSASRLPYVLAGVVLLVTLGLAWGERDDGPVAPGAPAPSFEAHDLDGAPVRLEDYRGRVVLLNIWATWCFPCRTEMPSMQRLQEWYEGADFDVVAVSIDEAPGSGADAHQEVGREIRAFADSLGLTFDILHDSSGEIQEAYRAVGVPESFVIGRDGVIYRRVPGATRWDTPENRELVDRLLQDGA